jgi:hypothetical protein
MVRSKLIALSIVALQRACGEQCGRGNARHLTKMDGAAAIRFDDFATDDFRGCATFGKNVRAERFEQLVRCRIVENQHVIDAVQGSDHCGAITIVDDWAIGPFEQPDAGIAVDGHDQDVSQPGGLLQAGDMADMEQVETAIGKNECLAATTVVVESREECGEICYFGGSSKREV